MKIIGRVLFVILIFSAFVCGIDLYRDFSVKNAEVGTIYTIETETNVEEVINYDLEYIDFEPGEAGFECTYTYDPIDYDATVNSYKLTLNGIELTNLETTAGTISGDLIKTFYDTSKQVDSVVIINFSITYTVTATTLEITAEGATGQQLSYFNTYQNINGVLLKLVKEI